MKSVFWTLSCGFCLLALSQTPALANIEIAPESAVLLCFNPVTGQQITLDQAAGASCPDGYEAYPLLTFEQVAGAPPLQGQQEQATEGHDARSRE
ncbi:MAG: hypothetical protein AB7P52_05255 [Alphaproteobacteria bacterium]